MVETYNWSQFAAIYDDFVVLLTKYLIDPVVYDTVLNHVRLLE